MPALETLKTLLLALGICTGLVLSCPDPSAHAHRAGAISLRAG
ncbi:MAG: hypothetical protein ACK5MY_16770 [Jhaorihella sp.]